MKLYCIKCKYKFEKNNIPARCPYCSADNTVKNIESAQNILDDVTKEMEIIEKSRKERSQL